MPFEVMKPGTLLAPVPAVLVSVGCEEEGQVKTNLLAVAWTGTVCSDPPMLSVSVRKERYSYAMLEKSGEFVVNLVGQGQLKALDFCGVRSGRDMDKFAACDLTRVPAEGCRYAPAIAECPMYLSCRVEHTLELGSHTLFVGKIVGLGVEQTLLDEGGRIDFSRAKLVAYNHGTYYGLGKALGFFGYSVAAPDVLARRMASLRNPR